MQVRLSRKLERFVRQLVLDGDYGSVDEVVAQALTAFAHEQLRRDIAVAAADVRAGRVSDWDLEEAKQDLLRQLKRKKNGVMVEAYVNNVRFAYKMLHGLEGRTGKVALGCRNLSCGFRNLTVQGIPVERPKKKVAGTAQE